MMDKETQEKELAKSFENVRADEANVFQMLGIRMVAAVTVLEDFESRNPEAAIEEEEFAKERFKEVMKPIQERDMSRFHRHVSYSDRLFRMYTLVPPIEFGSEFHWQVVSSRNGIMNLIIFPEDQPLFADLKNKNLYFLLQDLSDAVNQLEGKIGWPREDFGRPLRDIRSCLDEVDSQVKRMRDAISRIEAN